MVWHWEIARNDGRPCLYVADMAKNMSVIEPLSSRITIGEFIDLVIRLGDKITNCDFREMIKKIERSRDSIKDKLLLWNTNFELSWDFARGFYYIQVGLCPSRLVTKYGRHASEIVHIKFAVVYLDRDFRMFWTLSADDAQSMLYNYSMKVGDSNDNELKMLLMTFEHSTATSLPSMFEYVMEKRMKEVKTIFKAQGQEASNAELEKFMSKMTLEEVFAGLDNERLKNSPASYRTLLRCWELSLKRLREGKKTRLEVSL